MVQEGGALIRERVAKYGIDCDLKQGNIFTAFHPKQVRELEAKQALVAQARPRLFRDARPRRLAAAHRIKRLSRRHDRPFRRAHAPAEPRCEAAAFVSLGGTIYSRPPRCLASRPLVALASVVKTAVASVPPQGAGILAGNAYLGHTVPELENRVMPFSTGQSWRPSRSGVRAKEILPSDMCVEDVRYVLDYYRLSVDGRPPFGGGTVYGGTDPADIAPSWCRTSKRSFRSSRALRSTLSGRVTARSPSAASPNGAARGEYYFAQGYSGHGVVGSHLFGSSRRGGAW